MFVEYEEKTIKFKQIICLHKIIVKFALMDTIFNNILNGTIVIVHYKLFYKIINNFNAY